MKGELHLDRKGFILSRLSKRYPQIYRQTCLFRMELETAVLESNGAAALSFRQSSLVNAACRYELISRVAEYTVSKKLSISVLRDLQVAAAMTQKRNQCIDELLIGRRDSPGQGDPWDEIDHSSPAGDDEPDDEPADDEADNCDEADSMGPEVDRLVKRRMPPQRFGAVMDDEDLPGPTRVARGSSSLTDQDHPDHPANS